MKEQEFWNNNPHMTPQLQAAYKDRWRRIMSLDSKIEKLFTELDEINEKRLTAINLKQYDEVDNISMQQWELNKKASILIMTLRILFVQVGASKSYKFELN